jgi:hypothetical protein
MGNSVEWTNRALLKGIQAYMKEKIREAFSC